MGDAVLEAFAVTAGDTRVTQVCANVRVVLAFGRDTLVAVRAAAPDHESQRVYTVLLEAGGAGVGSSGRPASVSEPVGGDLAASVATQGVVAAGSAARGVIGEVGGWKDADWFAVELCAGGRYVVEVVGAAGGGECTLQAPLIDSIRDGGGAPVAGTEWHAGGRGSYTGLEFTPAESGVYFVAVTGEPVPGAGVGSYAVALTDAGQGSDQRIAAIGAQGCSPAESSPVPGTGSAAGSAAKRRGPGPLSPWARSLTRTTDNDDSAVEPSLSGIEISEGTLAPEFASGTFSYAASVAHDVAQITVTPAAPEGVTALVTSPDADADAPGHQVALNAGRPGGKPAQTAIVITASTATDITGYTLTVTRAALPERTRQLSSDATLSALDVGGLTLTPAFASATTAYTATAATDVETVTVAATANNTAATAAIDPEDADGDATGHQVELAAPRSNGRASQTTITVTVTAEDSTTNTYTVTVNRTAPSVPEPTGGDIAADATTQGRLAPDDYVTGTFNGRRDVDWYAVDLEAGTRYFFYVQRHSEHENAQLPRIAGIYSADGPVSESLHRPSRETCWDDFGAHNLFLQIDDDHDYVMCDLGFWRTHGSMAYYRPESDGTYYVGVSTLSYLFPGVLPSWPDSYALIARNLDRDLINHASWYTDTGAVVGQLELDTPAAGFLEWPREQDYFEIELQAGRQSYLVAGSEESDITGKSAPIASNPHTTQARFTVKRVMRVTTHSDGKPMYTLVPPSWWTDNSDNTVPTPGDASHVLYADSYWVTNWYHESFFLDNPQTFTAPADGTYLIQVGETGCRRCGSNIWGGYQVTVTDVTDVTED